MDNLKIYQICHDLIDYFVTLTSPKKSYLGPIFRTGGSNIFNITTNPNFSRITNFAGTEAMFADVGHFTVRSIQISMCSMTYPALILAYTGQASFLRKNSDLVSETFYKSIPGFVHSIF